MAQLQNELAERELLKKFRHENSWMGELKAKNEWVNNDVIKIPRQGTAPLVLINNNIYPIASNRRDDDFIAVSLNKYETENTIVTDDELYALPYEKTSDVQMQHRETLEDKTAQHGLFSISAPSDTNKTPIIECTGDPDPVTGRRRMTTPDLIKFWELQGPLSQLLGRNLTLSYEHAADLMLEDATRQRAWGGEWMQGTKPQFHVGFNLWVSPNVPKYEKVNGVWTKKAFESVDGRTASVFFHKSSACKATGSIKRYALPAELNPTMRENTIGFRLYAICVGLQDEGFGAIVSPVVE